MLLLLGVLLSALPTTLSIALVAAGGTTAVRASLVLWFLLYLLFLLLLLLLLLLRGDYHRVLFLQVFFGLRLADSIWSLDDLEVFDVVDFENDRLNDVLVRLDFIFPIAPTFSTK